MNRFAGKFIGTVLGLLLAGPTGAILGLFVGHVHDVRAHHARHNSHLQQDFFPDFSMSQNQKSIFSLSVIVLGAKLAKADGHVSREEVLAFRRIFRSPPAQLSQVGILFDRARLSSDDYEPYAARLAGTFSSMPHILEEILAGLFYIAIADSPHLSHAEVGFLHRVATIFGFHEDDFRRIAGRVGIYMTSAPPPPKPKTKNYSAYEVLGVSTQASNRLIKKTYHAMIRTNHPDILHAQGVSTKQIEEATERMKKINAAYSKICKERGMK